MQNGRPTVAAEYFKNALASSARMAPAWEALAAVELNAGHVDAALQDVGKALEINARRASAHFLAALAHAKVGQREPAAGELRAAFELDPGYVEEARQSDVITRLFTPSDLEALGSAPATQESPPGSAPSTESAPKTQ
jgi:tetratricopeptide (TPR) repeat protein